MNVIQAKLNALSVHFNLQHFHRHMIADLGRFATKFADMNQSISLDPNINEAPERCYIRNGTGQHRSWLQIGHFLYTTLEQRLHIGVIAIVSVQFTAQRLQNAAQLKFVKIFIRKKLGQITSKVHCSLTLSAGIPYSRLNLSIFGSFSSR